MNNTATMHIDTLVRIMRNADKRADALFELNTHHSMSLADACGIINMKLSQLPETVVYVPIRPVAQAVE